MTETKNIVIAFLLGVALTTGLVLIVDVAADQEEFQQADDNVETYEPVYPPLKHLSFIVLPVLGVGWFLYMLRGETDDG